MKMGDFVIDMLRLAILISELDESGVTKTYDHNTKIIKYIHIPVPFLGISYLNIMFPNFWPYPFRPLWRRIRNPPFDGSKSFHPMEPNPNPIYDKKYSLT